MDAEAFARVAETFADFHLHFASLFGEVRTRVHSAQYLAGLLVQQERRNAENLAESQAHVAAQALQWFLTDSPWPWEPVIAALQAYTGDRISTPEGVWIIDDTGDPKKGRHSVGVQRQYSGTLGRVDNCQIGVLLAYTSARGTALLDTRLYLPTAWTDDPARCRPAHVPATVTYRSKAELAVEMVTAARQRGHLAGRWVVADALYGEVPTFRDTLDAAGWWYVVDVPCTTTIFTEEAAVAVPAGSGQGRRPTRPQLVDPAQAAHTVEAVIASRPAAAWTTYIVAQGAQGPRRYQYVALRVWESRDGLPGRACWLLGRRNADGERKYALSNAPADTRLQTLAEVQAHRWPVETAIQQAKDETGLDEYEVRTWPGWYHHMAMVLLAQAFLLSLTQEWGEKGAGLDAAPGGPCPSPVAAAAGVDA